MTTLKRSAFVLMIALSPASIVHPGVTNPDISALGQVLLSNPADSANPWGQILGPFAGRNGAGPGRRIKSLFKGDVHFLNR